MLEKQESDLRRAEPVEGDVSGGLMNAPIGERIEGLWKLDEGCFAFLREGN